MNSDTARIFTSDMRQPRGFGSNRAGAVRPWWTRRVGKSSERSRECRRFLGFASRLSPRSSSPLAFQVRGLNGQPRALRSWSPLQAVLARGQVIGEEGRFIVAVNADVISPATVRLPHVFVGRSSKANLLLVPEPPEFVSQHRWPGVDSVTGTLRRLLPAANLSGSGIYASLLL